MLVKVAMKIFRTLCFSILILATYIDTITSSSCDGNSITYVAMNLTSFPCPDSIVGCRSLTMDQLIKTSTAATRILCSSEVIFQEGSYDAKKTLTLLASKDLIIRGQNNVTITCIGNLTISLKSAFNITIKEIEFHTCSITVVTPKLKLKKRLSSTGMVVVTNSAFNTSHLTLKDPNSKQNKFSVTLVAILQTIELINASLTLEKADHINITGKDSAIICTPDSKFILDSKAQGTIKLSDIEVQDCRNIIIRSRSKIVTFETNNALFDNSCLLFEAIRTRSPNHILSINMTMTKIEHCSCKFLQLHANFSINISILLNNISVIGNDLLFIEFEDNHNVSVTVMGHCLFQGNRNFILYLGNGLIHFVNASVDITDCTIIETSTAQGAPIYTQNSIIIFEDSTVLFDNNRGSLSGGIVADATQTHFKNNVTVMFYNNSGPNGGALSLYSESRLHFNASSFSNIALYFNNNVAQLGGAIYVDDSRYRNIESIIQLYCEPENVRLTFGKNVASLSGNQIYGGWIDWFMNETTNIPENETDMVNNKLIEFENQSRTQDLVSSHPIRICLCINNDIDCNITDYNMTIYGKALTLELVGVGQRYTPIISHVEANLSKSGIYPMLMILQSACTKINYRIDSQNDETITLTPYLPYLYYSGYSRNISEGIVDNLFEQLVIKLKINECPWGFKVQANGSCECQLSNHSLQCDMNEYTILRSRHQWVGATCEHRIEEKIPSPGVISHQHCPFDYCRSDGESLSIRLENQDEQCAFNREGILCGGCRENLSRVLGTSNCLVCNNQYTLLIVFSWLISGFVLVACLMLLNLTVSVGTINGLTFYANIIRAQHTTFFAPDISTSFLSIFIAWLNLDMGAEMCLYDGLDSYVITWLQYIYPLYIWLIAAIIIILSHFSSRISKLCGKNAVQVLATLFLISYARLLRLMIEVFSFTWITYPDGYKKAVWLVDGNYKFFKGKLIPLVLVTIIFVLLSLPYTFTLLMIQFLQKLSHYPILFWVRRLKPFFDAYTGPYKSRHRYWTGLLLVARLILLITFSINQSNNVSINLLAIITVSFVLLGWLSSANLVYASPLNNFLEIVFFGNLGLTSAAVLFNVSNDKTSPVAIYLSTSIAFVLLIFIILYHVYQRLVLTKLGSKLTVKVMRMIPFKINSNDIDDTVELPDMIPTTSGAGRSKVTYTMVDLDQPSSHAYDSYNSQDLKEPLLEDDK